MDSCPNELHKAIADLFPDQVEVHTAILPVKRIARNSLLHQHFHEPLSADKQEQLIIEITGYLSGCDEHSVYSYFFRSNHTSYRQPEWHMSTAMLKKSGEGLPNEVVIFTYNLVLLGDSRKSFYRVLEEDAFFKTHFNKVSLLTKKEKEIISLVALGNTSNQIADKLFISIHTVSTHRKNINNKLAIKSIADIMRVADVFDLTTSQHD
ncbi:MAG TPA: helix-turn-helix transcriptional regulator [Mucilaginibacter sp.]|nr:helix-turn-helix transcriptional regulator [Mucilaginibacter sp.]